MIKPHEHNSSKGQSWVIDKHIGFAKGADNQTSKETRTNVTRCLIAVPLLNDECHNPTLKCSNSSSGIMDAGLYLPPKVTSIPPYISAHTARRCNVRIFISWRYLLPLTASSSTGPGSMPASAITSGDQRINRRRKEELVQLPYDLGCEIGRSRRATSNC